MKLTRFCSTAVMTGLMLTGCGGGGGGGSAAGSESGTGGLSTSSGGADGVFGQSLYIFENEPVYTGETVVDQVIRTRVSRNADVLSVQDTAILGPAAVPPGKEYAATASGFATAPSTATDDGVRSAFLTESTDKSFTIAAFAEEGVKTVGKKIFHFETKNLSGLLLTDYVGAQLNRGVGGTGKVLHLRNSGRTFPSGSEMLSVTRMTYLEDTVEFSAEDLTEYSGLAQWRSDHPGATFQDYAFKETQASCVADPAIPVQYRDCAVLWKGGVYTADVYPKGDYVFSTVTPLSYFNGVAADALTTGIQADFR